MRSVSLSRVSRFVNEEYCLYRAYKSRYTVKRHHRALKSLAQFLESTHQPTTLATAERNVVSAAFTLAEEKNWSPRTVNDFIYAAHGVLRNYRSNKIL
jgi:site-specific recombinase XerD